MVTVRPKGTTLLSFNAPDEMVEALDRIAMKRWKKKNRTELLIEAVSVFIKMNENPAYIDQIISERLDHNPGLVAEAMQIYKNSKSQK